MPFAADYVRWVLDDNFEDAKTRLLDPLLAIHDAHLVMLAECGILPADDARRLAVVLEAIDPAAIRATTYDATYEDLFFLVERLIAGSCDAGVGGRLHTARSRNDIDMTMYRIRLREEILHVARAVLALREVLLAQAVRHRDTVFPAHTHTQPAQPTTVAHYLHAVVEQLERDSVRLAAALATVNRCPLGACAITGTGFPIARDRTADLLGFDGPTGNTYGSIATADYVIEAAAAAANLLVGCGRFVQDLLLWSTVEVGYLRLADGFVQTSSIMPQKRNPVALEHARSLMSKALGQTLAVVQVVHNTPFGDIVDTEDDLQPLVAAAFRDTRRGVAVLAAAMGEAELDVARMAARAESSWVTVTELADTLARRHGLPFAAAHAVTADAIGRCGGDRAQLPAALAAALAAGGHAVAMSDGELRETLSPTNFVRLRETPGGPGPAAMARAMAASHALLEADAQHLADIESKLAAAAGRRRSAVAAIARRPA